MTPATIESVDRIFRDFYPRPGERVKQYVVDMRREHAWARETCPRFEVRRHLDNTIMLCRNQGAVPWFDLDHDCCSRCEAEHAFYLDTNAVQAWLVEKAARPPIEPDKTKYSEEVAPCF